MRKSLLVAALILAIAMMGSTGCRRVKLADTPSGKKLAVSTETTTVALGDAEGLDMTVRQGVGVLKLAAGEPSSTTAMDATFAFAPVEWKPEVTYSVEETRGVLYVGQTDIGVGPEFGKSENTWEMKVSPDVPVKLSLKLGVGEADVDLRGVDVTGLEAITGVGEATFDLSGERTRDLTARIEAGVGEVTIRVPSDVGVRIVGAQDGLGDFSADGFERDDSAGATPDGNDLVNDAFAGDGPKIELFITRGIGEVTVVSVD